MWSNFVNFQNIHQYLFPFQSTLSTMSTKKINVLILIILITKSVSINCIGTTLQHQMYPCKNQQESKEI